MKCLMNINNCSRKSTERCLSEIRKTSQGNCTETMCTLITPDKRSTEKVVCRIAQEKATFHNLYGKDFLGFVLIQFCYTEVRRGQPTIWWGHFWRLQRCSFIS